MESCVRSLATPMSTYHGLSFTRCLLHVHSSGTPQRQTSSFPSCRGAFGWNTGTHTHHTPRAVSDWPVPVRSLSVRSSLNLSRHHRRHQQQQRTTAIQQLCSQHTRVQSACLVLVVKHNVCVGLRARLRRPRPVKHVRQLAKARASVCPASAKHWGSCAGSQATCPAPRQRGNECAPSA